MPTTYTNSDDSQFNRATFEVDPTLGMFCAGMRVVDGFVVSASWRTVEATGTGNSYGYNEAGSGFDVDPSYFETITSGFYGIES